MWTGLLSLRLSLMIAVMPNKLTSIEKVLKYLPALIKLAQQAISAAEAEMRKICPELAQAQDRTVVCVAKEKK